jgi:hypothetical protein
MRNIGPRSYPLLHMEAKALSELIVAARDTREGEEYGKIS